MTYENLKEKLQKLACLLIAIFIPVIAIADPVEKEYVIDERGELPAFSRAVSTQGGRTI